ncbi:MFS transporter [Novosphingobium mangrovi (ex Huang et al. 2023)]|uniref:MFS transporter n=1 Tax=Novosphingobium mangrovi (ex Huang et al. 2023) TaxID=2976432 RepID=A0ABT2I6M3_9SPHN|nr:MFS transporter [Novosphingobium mangrovi (ex Huang et al. 2023)]MCT2400448.1 MFS transporter [Novosphingobium mangrovi (ex Huang et al. 2023)]
MADALKSLTRGTPGGVLAACTVGNSVSVTPAVHAVFGLFLVPLSEEFGWSRASISGVLGVLALVGAVSYPLIGRHVDKGGARRTLLAGVFGLALSIAALAMTGGSLLQFYATFAVLAVFGAMAGTPIFQKVIADWFDKNRGTALGVSAGGGNGLGSVILPVLAAVLVQTWGWRAGYLGVSGFMLLIAFPLLWLMLRDRAGSGHHVEAVERDGLTLGEAAQTPAFWLILIALAAGAGGTTAVFSHVVPILGDRGFSVATGTAVVGVFALVTSGWQIATGRIMDMIPSPRVVVPMYLMAVIGLVLLETGTGMTALVIGGALLGVGLGGQFGALPYFIGRYFGTRHFGSVIGAMYSAVIAAQGTTPILLDAVFDAQHSYRPALVGVGGALMAGAVLLMLLPRYNRAADVGEGLLVAGH